MGKPTTQNSSFINHFSHPHGLQLTPASSSPPCSACQITGGDSPIYSCKPCNFSLHETCSKMKQVITHPSHPSHTLSLLVAPIYDGGYFNCDACGVIGTGFSYQCSLCDFDIHALCAHKPLSIVHKSHPQHSLKLAFESPYGAEKGFSCDICLNIGKNQWLYQCIPCEFDAHVGCIGPLQPHLLQHSTSAPTPDGHHAGHAEHQNSLHVPGPRSIGPNSDDHGADSSESESKSSNDGYNVLEAGEPVIFNGPQVLNGSSEETSNANGNGGNNNNYNEVYNGEDNVGYEEGYGDVYTVDDGDCNLEDGGYFIDGGAYDENDFESYGDTTGGNESMYDGEESYGTTDDSQYGVLNDEPTNQYAPVARSVGGQGLNNQNQYDQIRRPVNMGRYGRGGTTNMNTHGNMNQGAYSIQPRTMGPTTQYRSNGLGNTNMMMNSVVRSMCQGLAMGTIGVGGDGGGNGVTGYGGGLSIMGGLYGDDSESQL